MKIKGKIDDLRTMLEKVSCGGIFDPVTLKLKNKSLQVGMTVEGKMASLIGEFSYFDIEGEEGKTLSVDSKELLEQLKPIPGGDEFELEIKEGSLYIKTKREEIMFRLDADWREQSMATDDFLFEIEDGVVVFSKKSLTTKMKMDSNELREIISRRNLVKVEFIEISNKDGITEALIGDLASMQYHPRKYTMKAEVERGGGESTKIGFALPEISEVISGEIEFHYADNYPIAIFDEGENYGVTYVVAPLKEVTS